MIESIEYLFDNGLGKPVPAALAAAGPGAEGLDPLPAGAAWSRLEEAWAVPEAAVRGSARAGW